MKIITMMKKKTVIRIIAIVCAIVLSASGTAFCQPGEKMIPTIVEKDGRHALLVDGQPFLMLGGQAHNSSSWPGMLPAVWSAIKAMHANTLETPIYWE